MHASTEIFLFAGNFTPRGYQACNGSEAILNSRFYYEFGYRYSRPPVPGSNAKVSLICPQLETDSFLVDRYTSPLQFQICANGGLDMYGDVGMIKMYAGKTLPKGWIFCEGQELSIASYPALFEVIGNKYGGNGTTNFALPKLKTAHLSPIGKAPQFAIATSTIGDDYARESMYGAITLYVGDTAPANWIFCEGQEFQISDDTTLFSIIGPEYGGNGRQTFGAPNLNAASITEGAVAPKFIMCKEGMYPSRA